MRKKTSTNSVNEARLNVECGISYALSIINGRWKVSIISYLLIAGQLRYSALKRKLIGISERILIAQLKALENDGIVERVVYPGFPPRVEYKLTEVGRSLEPLLYEMSEWGVSNRPK